MATLSEMAESNDDIHSDLHNTTLSHAAAARSIGCNESAVRKYRKRHGIRRDEIQLNPVSLNPAPKEERSYDVEDAPERDIGVENSELRAQNKRLFTAYSKEKLKSERILEQIYTAARDAAQHSAPVTPVPKPVRDRRTKQEEFALIHATDWQRSKVTESYNSEIADKRVAQFADKVGELTDIMRADHPVRHGVVLFTGDMLEGCKIFSGQEWEVDATIFDQLFGVVNAMEFFVKKILAQFETIDVICEYGNHGRIGKPSDGWKASDNFDRIAYGILESRMKTDPRVLTFQQSGSWYQMHTVGNYTFMAIHGDEIKSFGGNLPAYGLLRKSNAWASGVVEPFRDLYCGHYHQSMQLQMANGGSVYMTGSTESHNEFAREFVAGTSQPSQRINFVNPVRGLVTYESRIWLD